MNKDIFSGLNENIFSGVNKNIFSGVNARQLADGAVSLPSKMKLKLDPW